MTQDTNRLDTAVQRYRDNPADSTLQELKDAGCDYVRSVMEQDTETFMARTGGGWPQTPEWLDIPPDF